MIDASVKTRLAPAVDAELLREVIADLLPLLRCPVGGGPLRFDAERTVLVSDRREYPVVDGVLDLNPTPSDVALNAYYEEVNGGKIAIRDPETFDAFAEIWDPVENYYRRSRRDALARLVPRDPGSTLDVGGGHGALFRSILRHLGITPRKLILVDWAISQARTIAPALLSRERCFIQADALRLPFHDASVDTIFNSEMIEHLLPEQSEIMLREFFRVLRPGGRLLLTTPNGMEYRRLLQEGALTAILLLKGGRQGRLMDRERLKSKLLRRYLKVTGHQFVNVGAAEKAGQIGHFNVLTPRTLRRQMAAVGFRRVGGTYAIFCPLVVSSGMKASPSRATVLPRLEGLFRASGAGGLMLACQMHLLQKPS